MKAKEFTCCICGQTFTGYGNNPAGAMGRDKEGNLVELTFKPEEVCCDDCNSRYVITGRLYRMSRGR
jgi:DNA-directed RNA polymerase subunit RPC12/RpoP